MPSFTYTYQTLSQGSSPYVYVTDLSNNYIINFGIPSSGSIIIDTSNNIVIPQFSVYQTNTLSAGQMASVLLNSSGLNYEFTFNIPMGSQGPPGTNGTNGTNGSNGSNGKDGVDNSEAVAGLIVEVLGITAEIATITATTIALQTQITILDTSVTVIEGEITGIQTQLTEDETNITILQNKTQNIDVSTTTNSTIFDGSVQITTLNSTNLNNSATIYTDTISANKLVVENIETTSSTINIGDQTPCTTINIGNANTTVTIENQLVTNGIENYGTTYTGAINTNSYNFSTNSSFQTMNIGTNATSTLLSPNYINIGSGYDVITINGLLIISNTLSNQPINISSFISQFR
jgi:hypothetical protein